MLRYLTGSVIICACLLGAAACGKDSALPATPQASATTEVRDATATPLETSTPSPSPTSAARATPSSISQGSLAPDFSFTLSQGQDVLGSGELQLSQFRGKPVVLNFWARLCGPCWKEMPELQGFYEEYQGRIELLGIDTGEFTGYGSYRDSTKLLQSLGVTYPVGFTGDGKIVHKYKVVAMPTTVFISAEGEITKKWTGALDRDTVTRVARAMLD